MSNEWRSRSTHGWPPKHAPLPDHDRDQTVVATADGNPARYFPDVDAETVEAMAVRSGKDVPSGKPATYYRVLMLDEAIGASDGQISRWVLVESTSGDYHGRPITERRFRQLLAKAEMKGDG